MKKTHKLLIFLLLTGIAILGIALLPATAPFRAMAIICPPK